MQKTRRWKLLMGGLALSAALIYGYQSMTTGWETISSSFLRNDKPYGGGAFRVRGDEVMTLKLADPPVTFKPASEQKHPGVAEPTEAWMNDTAELLNRGTVSFLRGLVKTGLTRTFQTRGQDAAWWYSKDWRTAYIGTGWTDYKASRPANGLAPHSTSLWRSNDGGETWHQLHWPADREIEQLLFLDAQRGYAIGWGPHVWRTADGGQTWQEIKVPPLADIGKPRRTFDGVSLGPDGVLRVAFYVDQFGDIKASSLVYRLAWTDPDFERDVVLPDQVVADLQSSPLTAEGYSVYALSRLGPPRNIDDARDNGRRAGAISVWTNAAHPNVQQLHHFDKRLLLDGLSVGSRGVLLVYATDASGDGAPLDLTYLSKDFGKSWEEMHEAPAQGGYFDPETNTQYALFGYTLKKRKF